MKMNLKSKEMLSYLRELTIVTMGVLIALLLSNFKENSQARRYHKASLETINSEIKSNHSSLERIIEKQSAFLDTLTKYVEDSSTIVDLFRKTNGLQFATIHNSGLEFYQQNQLSSIEFEMMSSLINMRSSSELMYDKLEKLAEFTYSNAYSSSQESKKVVILHLQDVLNTEHQLLEFYKDFMETRMKTAKEPE